jgi:hypothetical protein
LGGLRHVITQGRSRRYDKNKKGVTNNIKAALKINAMLNL